MTAIQMASRACFSGIKTPTVSLSSTSVSHNIDSVCYANVGYHTDGVEYSNSSGLNNFNTSRGNWKDSGDAEGAWIDHTLNSGSALYTRAQVPGTRAQCGVLNRQYRQRDLNSSAGGVTSNITVTMYDAETGGSSLGSATFSLTATYFNACPTCCFTPDTMITMAWGGVLPIKDVQVGDEIVVYNPKGGVFETEKVEGIITRVNRVMFKVHFEDGTYIHISDDHPLHIPEKGPAAIAPTGVYKDLEHVRVLKVGDFVTHILECQCACDHEDRVRRVPRYRVHV
jgi:hypothetical protein